MANPYGNPENLRALSSDEARKLGRRGGIRSGEVRRQRKTLQELAKAILYMPMEPGEVIDIDPDIWSLASLEGQNITVGAAALLAAAKKAVDGDINAFKILMETAGEKPMPRVEVHTDIAAAEAHIAELIEEIEEKHKDDPPCIPYNMRKLEAC